MFTDLYAQLPAEVQSLFMTIATGLNIDASGLFFGCVVVIVYLLLVKILSKIHKKIITLRKSKLEMYTLAVDTIIYMSQKNATSGADIDWISNRDPSISYIDRFDQLKEKAQLISAELSDNLTSSYQSYKTVKGSEVMIGTILVILTVGLYKLVW